MTVQDLATLLKLPPNTNSRNVAGRALKQHCAGGAEILDVKEWASSVANQARTALHDPSRSRHADEQKARQEIATETIRRMALIQRAMLEALERAHSLPTDALTKYLRDGGE